MIVRPGRGYTKEDWDEVVDFPDSADEELATARPFAKVFSDLAASIRRDRKGRERAQAEPARPVATGSTMSGRGRPEDVGGR